MKLVLSLLVAALLGCAGILFLPIYKEPPVDPAWEVSGEQAIPQGAVTVRFTGTSTLLFSDGQSQWLIDGWFTRVSPV